MDDQFSKEMLEAHNAKRAIHGSPPLETSKMLTNLAADWATRLAKEGKFEHRPNNKYGENIFSSFNSDPKVVVSGKEAVDKWYSEIKDYPFGGEPKVNRSGHFTQLVWKGSKELGASRVKSNTGNYFVVANYNPPGNMKGAFSENVLPPVNSPEADSKDKEPNPGSSSGSSSSKPSDPVHQDPKDPNNPQVLNLSDIFELKMIRK